MWVGCPAHGLTPASGKSSVFRFQDPSYKGPPPRALHPDGQSSASDGLCTLCGCSHTSPHPTNQRQLYLLPGASPDQVCGHFTEKPPGVMMWCPASVAP